MNRTSLNQGGVWIGHLLRRMLRAGFLSLYRDGHQAILRGEPSGHVCEFEHVCGFG